MFNRILKSELKKLQYGKTIWVFIYVLIGAVALLALQFWALSDSINNSSQYVNVIIDHATNTKMIFQILFASTLSMISIFYAILLNGYVGREYKTTLRQTMIVVDDRKKYHLAKMINVGLMTLIFTVVYLVLGYLIYGIFMGFENFVVSSDYILDLLGSYVLLMGIIAVFHLLTVLTKNKLNIILMVLVFGFLFQLIITLLVAVTTPKLMDYVVYFPTLLHTVLVNGTATTAQSIVAPIMGLILIVGSYFLGAYKLSKQEL